VRRGAHVGWRGVRGPNLHKELRILFAGAPALVASLASAKSALTQGAQEPAKQVDFLFVQLKQQREEPKSEKEKMAIELRRTDSQTRVAFIEKIAAPVANKIFECGMFP
jgi:hypothetical protein